MPMIRSFLFGLGLLSSLLSSPPARQTENLFPATVGSTWSWRTTTSLSKDPIDIEVEIVPQKTPVANQVDIQYLLNGAPVQEEIYTVTDTEVARVNSGREASNKIDPPVPIIKYPMSVGKSWNWKGTITVMATDGGSSTFQGNADLKVGARETVKNDAGTFNAYRVDMNLTVTSGASTAKITNSYWFAPGVGMVKQVADINGSRTEGNLVKYTIK